MAVDHLNHTWRACHSKFILGFALDGAGIRAEVANGQFTVIGRTELHGHRAVELKFNVPPNNEAPPHVTAERLWVNAATYLPMQGYTRWSNGQRGIVEYVFLPAHAQAPRETAPGSTRWLHPVGLLSSAVP